jgi:hypothetical protein
LKIVRVAFTAIVAVSMGSAARAACGPLAVAAIDVAVREVPLVTQQDLSLADLQAMAAQLGRAAAHPVLGLYIGTVGYAVRDVDVSAKAPASQGKASCPQVRIRADLVVVDRRIVVASDLSSTPCLFAAALDHYQRHAAAAHVALQEFASALPGALGPGIDAYVRNRIVREGDDPDLRAYLDRLLDRSVATFMASLAEVQAGVDSPDQVRRLTTPCEAT